MADRDYEAPRVWAIGSVEELTEANCKPPPAVADNFTSAIDIFGSISEC